MQKILFVCHGNICRSPMAQYLLAHLAAERGLACRTQSAATSREEIGNPIYPPARRKLREKGIPFGDHRAVQMTRQDYGAYDLLLAMDQANVRNMTAIAGGDPAGKIRRHHQHLQGHRQEFGQHQQPPVGELAGQVLHIAVLLLGIDEHGGKNDAQQGQHPAVELGADDVPGLDGAVHPVGVGLHVDAHGAVLGAGPLPLDLGQVLGVVGHVLDVPIGHGHAEEGHQHRAGQNDPGGGRPAHPVQIHTQQVKHGGHLPSGSGSSPPGLHSAR